MRKDIEWLKKEIVKLKAEADTRNKYGSNYSDEQLALKQVVSLIDQLEEPEITEEQAWNKIAEYYPENSHSLRASFEHHFYNRHTSMQSTDTAKINLENIASIATEMIFEKADVPEQEYKHEKWNGLKERILIDLLNNDVSVFETSIAAGFSEQLHNEMSKKAKEIINEGNE